MADIKYDAEKDSGAYKRFVTAIVETASVPTNQRGGLEQVVVYAKLKPLSEDGVQSRYLFEARFLGEYRGKDGNKIGSCVYSDVVKHEYEDGAFEIQDYLMGRLVDIENEVREIHPQLKTQVSQGKLTIDSYFKRFH